MSPRSVLVAAAAATIIVAPLVNAAMAAAYDNITDLENAALFLRDNSIFNPGFGPRYFVNGMPPTPAMLPVKAKRQDQIAQCPDGRHSCLELGPLGAESCCSNDQYCFINSTWQVNCCAQGATCGSPCSENLLFCNRTITSTATLATGATRTVLEVTSLAEGCCGRLCSSSYFLCQSAFGGQCCAYGARCASDSRCVTPPTSAVSTVVTPAPPGCTTSQITCATGGGCCDIGSTCTSGIVSATQTTLLCAANLTVVENESSSGLSEGARVGIGVGVAVGAAIVIGALTWFWIRRRRGSKSRGEGGEASGSRRYESEHTGDLMSPFIPPGGTASDITSPSSRMGVRPRLHEHGLTYEYYGPNAVAGPYTDLEEDSTPGRTLGVASRASPAFSEHAARAATHYPEGPGDIVRPTELDAPRGAHAELGEHEPSIGGSSTTVNDAAAKGEPQAPLFELYGSPVTSPAPMNAEEAEQHRTQGISSPSPPPPAHANKEDRNSGHE